MATAFNIRDVLENVKGNSFVGLDTEVVVPLKGGKSNPMKNRVTKRTTGSQVQIFTNKNSNGYQNMVHRRLATQLRDEAAQEAARAKDILAGVLTEEQMEQLAGTVDSFLEQAERLAEAKQLFTLSPRKWGERIPGTPLVQHTKAKEVHPEFYLEVIFLKAGTSQYFLDGLPIAKDAIQGLDEPVAKEGAQVQGGLKAENQVQVRSYSVASLTGVRIDGTDYQGDFYYA